MKTGIPTVIGGILGLLMILSNFVKYKPFQDASNIAMSWIVVVSGFAMLLGAINMLLVHSKRIQTKAKDYDESIVLIVSLLVMAITGIFIGRTSPVFTFLFNNIVVAVGSTLFATMVFWIASASYRTFRVRNLAALVVLVSAALTILGRAPMSVVISDRLPFIAEWLMGPPTAGAQRAVLMCGAVGAIAVGIRVLLGIERGHMSTSRD
ncbi:MAG: hypothetical protein Q8P50_02355 [Bacillota bacterium]|nr:hypothetical protein [Bacillota bacterium]